jgi:type I restriction enzyme S subunit
MVWINADLADLVATIESGSRPKGGVSTDTGDVPSLGGENILQTGGISLEEVKKVPKAFYERMTKGWLQDRDVLINKDGANTGKVGLFRWNNDALACINEHVFLLRGKTDRLTQEYLYYTLLSNHGQTIIRNRISGSAQPGLKTGFITNFLVSLPESTDEQTTITVILATIDKAIEQTVAIIEKQTRIKTGLMQDLFTRGIDKHGNIRSETTHEFKGSPLGRIPMEWAVRKFDEITPASAPICYGIVQPGPYDDSGIRVAGIYSLNSDFQLFHMSARDIEARYSRSRIRAGDVLLSVKGTTGRVGVVPVGIEGNISRDLARIRPNQDVSPFFLRHMMMSEMFQGYLENAVVGTTRAEISIKILRALYIAKPQQEEQETISEIVNHSERTIIQETERLSKLRKEKAGLMQDLLTGKVPVTELLNKNNVLTAGIA